MMTFTVTMNNYQMEQFMQYLKGAKKAKAETEEYKRYIRHLGTLLAKYTDGVEGCEADYEEADKARYFL